MRVKGLWMVAACLGCALVPRRATAQEPPPVAEEPAPAPAPAPSESPSPSTEEQVKERKRAAFDLLSLYKDNYFLTGFASKHQAKFQFSVKFDLWPNEGHHALHFGYTQKARWNVYDPSAPFAENNYAPGLFYTFHHHVPRFEPPPGCAFFRERLGVEHESNGEGGADSRGWNRVYGSSRFACYDQAGEGYVLADLEVWAPPFGVGANRDLTKFIGFGELALSAGRDGAQGWTNDVDLTVRLRKGTRDWGSGSLQVDGRWTPPYPAGWRFTPRLVVQLFHGHGETLLLYDEVVTAFRVGIGFSDRSTRSR